MGYVLLAPYDDSMHLGQGFNSFLQKPCIDGAVKLTQADLQTQAARAGGPSNVSQVVSYSSRFVEKISDVVRSMNISAASSIKLGTIQVSGNSLSVDEAKFASSDMNAVISVKVINQITSAIKNPPFIPLKTTAGMTSERFFKLYGDSYISGFMEGGDLHGIVSMKVLDTSKKTNVETALKGAMNGSAGEFTLSEGTASSTIEAAVQETESTVTVNWSGGGQIKNDDAEWTLASLISAASAFPGRVAACPHKTYAILTPYNRNRHFVKWAEENNITIPDFSPVQQYTHDLLDSFMEFKNILSRIQAVIANPVAYQPSPFENAVDLHVEALVEERKKIKKEMAKIGSIVDKLNSSPSTLITEEVASPEVWATSLPVLVQSTMADNKLTASETAHIISGFCSHDPIQDTAEPETPASLGNKMNDSMKTVQDAIKEKEKEVEKNAPVVEICSASIKASLTQQERAFVDSEFNKRKYSQYRFGDLVGVPGGRFFVDTLFLEKAIVSVSWPDRIELLLQDLNDSRVYAVRMTYQETQESHGKNMGETVDSTFIDLEEGEVVNQVTLGRRDTTGVAFIRLCTSKNRETRIGTLKDCVEVMKCVPYDGCTGLKGFWGGAGDLVDRLGPIWVCKSISQNAPIHMNHIGGAAQFWTSNMDWMVENFQVPVPLGDCSIHVLIKNRESLEYAFIMDGGVDSGEYSAHKAIIQALDYVKRYLGSRYGIEEKRIMFNLWVVTHWDADHFRGMMDLIAKFSEKKKKNGEIEEEEELPEPTEWMAKIFVKDPMLYCGHLEKPFISQVSALGFKLTGGESALGLDMLSGVKIFNENGTPKPHGLDERRPRFCIVGADGYGISVPRFQQPVNRNQSSILAVLFWPGKDRQCCFYAGGDGFPELERKIISEFLTKSTIIKLGNGLDLMKLDHHGSSQENIYGGELRVVKSARKLKLADMPIGIFKAKNFLVTPGNLHGHPTYDVVQCLLDLLGSATGLTKLGRPKGRVWTTRSPYWATKKVVTTKDLSVYHNQDLEEIHEKNLDAYDDPTIQGLDPGMLLAVESQNSGKRLDRAKALKYWKKKILQQAAILDGENPTDYQVEKRAGIELLELRHMPLPDEEEGPKPTDNAIQEVKENPTQEEEGKKEEPSASTQFDCEYIAYDDVMNLRFAGHEMWNLICNQGIVPADIDPFFIVHFSWVNGDFQTVECLGRDGHHKDYKPEPSVPPRYSQRLRDLAKARNQKIEDPPTTETKDLSMGEEPQMINPLEQDGLFHVSEESGFFYDGKNQEKGQDSGIDLSMFDLFVPLGQFEDQAIKDHQRFTNISDISSHTGIDNLQGISSMGFDSLQFGSTILQTDFCTVASLATGINNMLLSYGTGMRDFSSTFKTNAQFKKSVATFEFTLINGSKALSDFRLQLDDYEDEEDSDFQAEDFEEDEGSVAYSSTEEEGGQDSVLDAVLQDDDAEIDRALRKLGELEEAYKKAWEKSKPPRGNGNRQTRTLERMANGVSEMKRIKEKAEKEVADIDPTLFTGDLDETPRAMIEELLVMAITYIPPARETKKRSGGRSKGAVRKQTEPKKDLIPKKRGRKSKKQMEVEKAEKDKLKREWEDAMSSSKSEDEIPNRKQHQKGNNIGF
ncbi:hypothetical protein FDENT_12978 [Fusarium denticulatum]|uniref:Jacalin-type lectin domain-containing protein n=1 Tax=Fusarium denticulatum TaxID=48507 RepID=A0A8H5T7H6_9HYPO|nr:hypothetical protein FDENT_12978 [Fusarium denticulatum]